MFGIADALGLNGRTAFMAAVLYIGNKAFVFFHAAYSYETLGILLFLTAWAVVAACARDRAFTRQYVPLNPRRAGGGDGDTSHERAHDRPRLRRAWPSSRASCTGGPPSTPLLLAAAGILLLNDWLVLHATKASEYLSAAFTARIGALIETLKNEGQGTRKLFGEQPLWLPERYVAYIYPLLVFALCGAGVLLLLGGAADARSGRCCSRS